MAKDKAKKTPWLGAGLLAKAGKAVKERGSKIAQQECTATGGKWENGRCVKG